MTSLRPDRLPTRCAAAARVIAGTGIFVAGLLAAGVFTSSAPAAPQDCLPVIGCVTTVVVPTVPLPTVTVPTVPTLTLPESTTTTGTVPSTTRPAAGTTPSTGTTIPLATEAAAFRPKATVRVRGRGARRLVEIRVNLTKPARLSALLSRKGGRIARGLFNAEAGPHLFRLRIGARAKSGPANLSLVYRTTSGEGAQTMHRLRLPR